MLNFGPSRGLGAGGRSVYLIFVVVLLRAWPRRSGTFFGVKRGGVGDADDQAVLSEKPGHRLSLRLGPRWVQQLEARVLKLAASRCDSFCVLDLELD